MGEMRQRFLLRWLVASALLACGYGCSGDTAGSTPMIDAGVEVDRDLPSDQGVNDASSIVDSYS